jgi:outer membrane lipoprotein-sorting protein
MKLQHAYLLAALLICAGSLKGQDRHLLPATPEQQQLMQQTIAAASSNMKSLTCDFEQSKTSSLLSGKAVSTGKMYYRNDGCLRWEYLVPAGYTLILNAGQIAILSGDRSTVVDTRMSRFFREMANIMMNGISGSGLNDSKAFAVQYLCGNTQWQAVLTPQHREMKRMFASITLTFNLTDYTVDVVDMQETGGDATIIRLRGKRMNEGIEDLRFEI